MTIGFILTWLIGSLMYPTYNHTVRKVPTIGLDTTAPWAVSLFEYKEHFATFVIVMLAWVVLSARRHEQLGPLERAS